MYKFMLFRDAACGTPTTHYINTNLKLTIVTHLSFSERIAIATLSLMVGCDSLNRISVIQRLFLPLSPSKGVGVITVRRDICHPTTLAVVAVVVVVSHIQRVGNQTEHLF